MTGGRTNPTAKFHTLAVVVDRLAHDPRTRVESLQRGLGSSAQTASLKRVGRKPIETAAFVDERKSLSIVGGFYLGGGGGALAQRVAGTGQLHL